MKAMIALLFLAAVAVYARAEMEYHPQAILHYLEMEDREMASKVRSYIKLDFPSGRPSGLPSGLPSGRPSGRPSGLPSGLPSGRPSGLPSGLPSGRPSFRPSGFPTGIPSGVKLCIVVAVTCHKRAGDDACKHLKCIKRTGVCLHAAGVRLHHLPDNMKKCLPIIPCCLLGSETCEEKLCCFVRFGECAKRLGDEKDAE